MFSPGVIDKGSMESLTFNRGLGGDRRKLGRFFRWNWQNEEIAGRCKTLEKENFYVSEI